jgi:hypothetical protein
MGTFIVSFIGHSFVAGALGTRVPRWLSQDPDKQRRILVVAFFTLIVAAIRWGEGRGTKSARGRWGALGALSGALPGALPGRRGLGAPERVPAGGRGARGLDARGGARPRPQTTPRPRSPSPRSLFGVLTIPDIAREGAEFVSRLKSDNVWVLIVEKTRKGLGDQVGTLRGGWGGSCPWGWHACSGGGPRGSRFARSGS